jgi:biopolymer transport protein ExbD
MPQEGQLAINLPKPEAAQMNKSENLPDDENKKDEWTISVFSRSGEIEGLSLKGPTTTRDNLPFAELQKQLKEIPKPSGRGNEAISITIEADDNLNYSRLIDVMNLCKYIGYESVGVSKMRPAPK